MTSSRLLVISSCTGDKAVKIPGLTLDDFADPNRLAQREHELAAVRRPAAAMYTGWQHVYLMRGVDKLRGAFGDDFVDLRILSAGYGLIEADRAICPYDVTFNDMGKLQARAWARRLGVPSDVRAALEDVEVAISFSGLGTSMRSTRRSMHATDSASSSSRSRRSRRDSPASASSPFRPENPRRPDTSRDLWR